MISILLPCYNGEKFISLAIDSILNQSFKDFELLIGFNGTTDNSKDIVRRFGDDRIKTFDYGDDKGKPKTLNKLLLEAKHDWISLQDDDDMWTLNKLQEQIKYLNDFDVIGTQIQYCDQYNNFIEGSPSLKLNDSEIKQFTINGNNQVANSSTLIRKSSIIKVGGWDENLDALEDFDLWIRLILTDCKFINLEEKMMIHRRHINSNFNTMSVLQHNKIMFDILLKNNIINANKI
jgi:glycosyltransferase involved in cell wall biosynthesis